MKDKNWVLLLCVFGMLAGCSSDENSAGEEIKEIKEAVLAGLVDPTSAQFEEEVRYFLGRSGACIKVNAKNRMGGYTGRKNASVLRLKSGNWQMLRLEDRCIYEHMTTEQMEELLYATE